MAWFLATGSQWELLQTYAWARMFLGYVSENSVLESIELTFEPENACELCDLVEEAQNSEQDKETTSPDAPKAKFLLLCQRPHYIHFQDTLSGWRFADLSAPEPRPSAPPTPPPRSGTCLA